MHVIEAAAKLRIEGTDWALAYLQQDRPLNKNHTVVLKTLLADLPTMYWADGSKGADLNRALEKVIKDMPGELMGAVRLLLGNSLVLDTGSQI